MANRDKEFIIKSNYLYVWVTCCVVGFKSFYLKKKYIFFNRIVIYFSHIELFVFVFACFIQLGRLFNAHFCPF